MSLDAFKTASKRAIQKIAKIAKKITKVLKNSQQNNSETVTMEMIKKCLKKYPRKDIYLQKKNKN